jgi:hypothetical protein
MPRERADIVAALGAKGFDLEKGGRDHDFFFFRYPNLTQPVYTKVSRGREYRTIGDPLLGKMRRQLHLTRAQFDSLVDCPMNRTEYTALLVSLGIIRKTTTKR